jgi:tryptophan synthase alpha chain
LSRISSIFTPGHKALIGYIVAGYPGIQSTVDTAVLLAESGCDIIELGIPFSDPIADGITIAEASHLALQNKTTPDICLEAARQISKRIDTPLMFMTYYNPIFHYGLQQFINNARKAGIQGLIVPDLPPDNDEAAEKLCQENGLDMVYLLAPNCHTERIKLVSSRSKGFIYLVSVTGVTGTRKELPDNIESFISRVRELSEGIPLCVGFGISTTAQAAQIAKLADGIIIGSRIVQLMGSGPEARSKLRDFIKGIRESLDNI